MLAIQTFLTILILILFFVKFRIGLCAYIAYIILIPYCNLQIGGLSFSWNLVNTALFLAYCIDCSRKCGKIQFAYKPFIPFFVLYGLLAAEMPFQDGVPFSFAINSWRLDLFNLILPIVLFSVSQYDNRICKYTFVTMVFACIIVVVYAFSLIPLQGINPYVMGMAEVNNAEILESQFGEQANRLMLKISSVFTHPMIFGVFLGMALVYFFTCFSNKRNIISLCVMAGLLSCIFFCGIRTPIAALFITVTMYLLIRRNFKSFFFVFVIGIIGYFIIIQIPELAETILSIADRGSSEVGGSSLEMRLEQLDAAFDEVRNCMMFGKGYAYTSYYWSIHGTHPRLYSFESLVFVILCNYGLMGFLIWGLMFYKLFKISKQIGVKSLGIFIILLITYYISYTCITGEYGYIKYLLLFYALLLINRPRNTNIG